MVGELTDQQHQLAVRVCTGEGYFYEQQYRNHVQTQTYKVGMVPPGRHVSDPELEATQEVVNPSAARDWARHQQIDWRKRAVKAVERFGFRKNLPYAHIWQKLFQKFKIKELNDLDTRERMEVFAKYAEANLVV